MTDKATDEGEWELMPAGWQPPEAAAPEKQEEPGIGRVVASSFKQGLVEAGRGAAQAKQFFTDRSQIKPEDIPPLDPKTEAGLPPASPEDVPRYERNSKTGAVRLVGSGMRPLGRPVEATQ